MIPKNDKYEVFSMDLPIKSEMSAGRGSPKMTDEKKTVDDNRKNQRMMGHLYVLMDPPIKSENDNIEVI